MSADVSNYESTQRNFEHTQSDSPSQTACFPVEDRSPSNRDLLAAQQAADNSRVQGSTSFDFPNGERTTLQALSQLNLMLQGFDVTDLGGAGRTNIGLEPKRIDCPGLPERPPGDQGRSPEAKEQPSRDRIANPTDMLSSTPRLSDAQINAMIDWNTLANEKLGAGTPEAKLFQKLGAAVITGDKADLEAFQKAMKDLKMDPEKFEETEKKLMSLSKLLPGADVSITIGKAEDGSRRFESLTLTQRGSRGEDLVRVTIPRTGAAVAESQISGSFNPSAVTTRTVGDSMKKISQAARSTK